MRNRRAVFEATAERYPKDPKPWFHLAQLQLLAGKREAAIADLDRSLEIAPLYEAARNLRKQLTGE